MPTKTIETEHLKQAKKLDPIAKLSRRLGKIHFSSRRVLENALFIIILFTFLVSLLFITNENSLSQTLTDILVLITGMVALVVAVMSSGNIERQERRMCGLHSEITEALVEIREINKNNEYLKRKMRETSKLDKEIAEEISKISKRSK